MIIIIVVTTCISDIKFNGEDITENLMDFQGEAVLFVEGGWEGVASFSSPPTVVYWLIIAEMNK